MAAGDTHATTAGDAVITTAFQDAFPQTSHDSSKSRAGGPGENAMTGHDTTSATARTCRTWTDRVTDAPHRKETP